MVLNLSEQEFMQMKAAVLDADSEEAFRLMKRNEQQQQTGMKSHLDER